MLSVLPFITCGLDGYPVTVRPRGSERITENSSNGFARYQVTATNEYFCTDTSVIDIKTFVNAPSAMPNAFSPNGDGKYDYLYVIGSADIKKVKILSVFNRYGQKIF